MKKAYLHLAAGLIATWGLTGSCDDYLYMDGTTGFTLSTAPYFIHTNTNYLTLNDVVETPYTFDIKNRSVPWQLKIADDWLKVFPASGDGTDTLTTVSVGADNNENTYYRISVMNLESQLDTTLFKYSHSIVAEQFGTSESDVRVDCDIPLYVPAAASTIHINVTHNTQKLEIFSNDSWMNVTQDEDGCSVRFEENTHGYAREGNIYFKVFNQNSSGKTSEEETYRLQVTQYVAQCSISENSLDFPNTTGSKTITISSDLSWTASSAQSWISVNPTNGTAGVTELTVAVVENNGISNREGSVTVRMADGTSTIIPVTQGGLYINASPSLVGFSDDGMSLMVYGNTYINVTLSTNLSFWAILSHPDWLTVTPENGESGVHTLTLKAKDNPETYERKGTVTIGNNGLGLKTTVDVTQNGKNFSLPFSAMNFEKTASSHPLTVNTNGTWTATTDSEWITVTPSSGVGTTEVAVSVTEHDGDTNRTGTIEVSVGSKTELVTVTQKGRYLTIERDTNSDLPSTGGNIELSVSSNQTWNATIKNQSPWLTLSATQGEGNAKLVITATENPSLESREDTIVFTPAGGQQGIKLPVKQAGRYLSTDASSVSFFHTGGRSNPVTVKTDGTFRVEKPEDATWLTIQQTDNLLWFETEAYNGEEPRKTTVSIYLTGLSGENTEVKMVDITVTQYTKTTQFIRLDYGEDKDFNLTYKDGVFISRKEFKEDKPFDSAPTENMNIGKEEYGEDKNYEY